MEDVLSLYFYAVPVKLRPMRYEPINPELFIENRKRLVSRLKPRSIVILHANDVLPTNADGTLAFKQNSDLFYLSGIDQEESILVLFPDAADEKHRELLFVRETSDLIAIWEGAKLTREQATEHSGIQEVRWLDDFENLLRGLTLQADHVYLNTNEHPRAMVKVETRDDRFRKDCMARYPLHKYERLAPLLHDLRFKKNPIEIAACGTTRRNIEASIFHEASPNPVAFRLCE